MGLNSIEQGVLLQEAQVWDHASQREAERCRVDEDFHDLHGQPYGVQSLRDHPLHAFIDGGARKMKNRVCTVISGEK